MRRDRLQRRGGFQLHGRPTGRTRDRLAELITNLARAKWGEWYECWPDDLARNNPCYVNIACDGVSWDGYVRKHGDLHKGKHVHSYFSMGAILKADKAALMDDGEIICGT